MTLAEFEELDGLGLAELVRQGAVSAVELVREAIDRIERRNGVLNAVVHKQYERALEEAAAAAGDGPFRGVPFLLKDLGAEQEGEPSTSSCRLLLDWRAPRDSELVARLRRAGLVILGRTNTPEFGIYATTEPALRGATHNPWALDRTPGGSSGGSAAAVAARCVPLAHASDGGGSIRIPAAHCGLFGLKPTRGRNPFGPYAGERWGGLVVDHVVTRSVRDSAAILDATHGPDAGAPYQCLPPARPFLEEVPAAPRKLRVAFTTHALFGDSTHADCIAACESAAALCRELGHEVEEATPSFDKPTLVRAYLTMVSAGVATSVRYAARKAGRKPRPEDFESPTWLMKLIGDHLTATEYVLHADAMQAAGRELVDFFEKYDVLLTPTAARPPVPLGTFALGPAEKVQVELLKRAPVRKLLLLALDQLSSTALAATPNTELWNLTGQPAMSVPLYWNAEGLPIGTQFVGRFGDEATLFRLAAELERARPWAGRRPAAVTGGAA